MVMLLTKPISLIIIEVKIAFTLNIYSKYTRIHQILKVILLLKSMDLYKLKYKLKLFLIK